MATAGRPEVEQAATAVMGPNETVEKADTGGDSGASLSKVDQGQTPVLQSAGELELVKEELDKEKKNDNTRCVAVPGEGISRVGSRDDFAVRGQREQASESVDDSSAGEGSKPAGNRPIRTLVLGSNGKGAAGGSAGSSTRNDPVSDGRGVVGRTKHGPTGTGVRSESVAAASNSKPEKSFLSTVR